MAMLPILVLCSLLLTADVTLATILSARQNVAGFTSCLGGSNNITVLVSTDSAYAQATLAYNRRLHYSPAAVVYPGTPQDVQTIVKCAASAQLPTVARSGGHSYAAFGLGGQDGALVVDLSRLTSLQVDQTTGYAVSQTGNRLGDLATGIWKQGKRALPHGTCPYVGTGGHASYGGFGLFSRAAGLLLDHVVQAEVILADGSLVTASSSSNPDLFWALRGAAPSFGIVTSWTFATVEAPPITINYQLAYSSKISKADSLTILYAFQKFAASSPPNELSALCMVASDNSGGFAITIYGSFYGTEEQFNTAFQPLRTSLPGQPTLKTNQYNWIDGLVAVDGPLGTNQPNRQHDNFFAKSLLTFDVLPNDTVSAWLDYTVAQGSSSGIGWWAQFDMYGGAIASVPESTTAYAHRTAIINIQFYGAYSGDQSFPNSGITFLNTMVSTLAPNPQAAYPNYIDPTLTSDQWHQLYYGSDIFNKLVVLKQQYDPNMLFNFPQAIPLQSTPSAATTNTSGTQPSNAVPQVASSAWPFSFGSFSASIHPTAIIGVAILLSL